MSEGRHPIRWQEADPITEAAEGLQAAGHDVKPWSKNYPLWLVDGETLTDGDLLALAVRVGIMDSTSTRLQ